jgi:ferredoxin-nitrate reductase
MGYKGFDFENPAAIYAEHVKLTAKTNIDISGLTYEILKQQHTVQWPYKKKGSAGGTPPFVYRQAVLYTFGKSYNPSGSG